MTKLCRCQLPQDYIEFGSPEGAAAKGRMRLEGKEYIVNDGDIMVFRFNV